MKTKQELIQIMRNAHQDCLCNADGTVDEAWEAALEAVFSHIGRQDNHIPSERPLEEPVDEDGIGLFFPSICDCPPEKRGVGCGHEGEPGIYCDTCAKLHPDYNRPDEIYNTDWNYQYRRFYLPNEKRENNYDYWKEQLKANKTPTLLKERDVKCNHIWTIKHVIYGDINSPCEAVCKFCGESPKVTEQATDTQDNDGWIEELELTIKIPGFKIKKI